MMSLQKERQHIRDTIKKKINILTQEEVEDLEKGIYNWTIISSDKNDIIKNWENTRFTSLYFNKAISVTANLDPDSYVENDSLLKRLKNGEFKPHDIPFMKPYQIFPDKWKEVVEKKKLKEKSIFEDKPEAMTDQFMCGKCKSRECVYREVQIRSCDEPMTIFIKCIKCGHKWRIG